MENNGRYTDFINQQNGTTNQPNYSQQASGQTAQAGYSQGQQGMPNGVPQNGYYHQARYGAGYDPNVGATPNQQNTYQARYGGTTGRQTNQWSNQQPGQTGYQNGATAFQATQPPKKKRKGLKALLIAALVILGVVGVGALAVWGTKAIKSNVNFTVNGKTVIGDEAKASDSQNDADTSDSDDVAGGSNAAGADDANTIKQATIGTGVAMTVVTDVTEVVKNTMPCLVSVNNAYVSKMNYFGQVYEQKGTSEGSGIIVGQNETELLLVSNNHVVQDAEELTITFVDEAQVPGYVKGTDADKDLAVIAVLLDDIAPATKEAISIAQLGDSEALTVGEPVVAIGNSLGYGQSVTTGVVSALHRPIGMDMQQTQPDQMQPSQAQPTGDVEIATFIQTDAAINPGNSGGALLNIYGQVIGINSNKIGGSAIEGMGYAIPISDAQPIIEDLMTMETRIKVPEEQRGILGITGVNVEKQYAVMYGMPEGVYISSLTEGAGAEAAGLTKGDIIVGLNEKGIESMDELKGELAYFKVGDKVTVTIMRSINGEYESQKIEVTLTKG